MEEDKDILEHNGYTPLCLENDCNHCVLEKVYCKKHLTDEIKQRNKKRIRPKELPSKNLINEYKQKMEKKKKTIIKNPIKNDKRVTKTGREHIFNGNRWVACCIIKDCSKQATKSIFCIVHYKEKVKVEVNTRKEKQCFGCYKVLQLEEFKQYKQCNNCRKTNKKNSINKHQRRREIYVSLKVDLGGKCIDCGLTDLEVLEFDHKDQKEKRYLVSEAPSIKEMKIEAKKCELRCRRCHQKRSQQQHDEKKTK